MGKEKKKKTAERVMFGQIKKHYTLGHGNDRAVKRTGKTIGPTYKVL